MAQEAKRSDLRAPIKEVSRKNSSLKGSQMTRADSERVALYGVGSLHLFRPPCLSSSVPPAFRRPPVRKPPACGPATTKKERASLFQRRPWQFLPRKCRFGEAPIPLQTRADNRRRVADFQSRPVINSRTSQPPC